MFQPFEVVLLYMCAAGDGYDAFMSCTLFEHLYFMMEVKKNFTSLCTCKSQWQAPSPFFCSFHGEVAKKRLNITQGLATWTSRKLKRIGCQGVSAEIFHHFNTSVSLWSNTAKFCLPGSLTGKHTAVCSWMCSIRVHGFKQLAGLLSCGIGHF